jgi:hypothetical protein
MPTVGLYVLITPLFSYYACQNNNRQQIRRFSIHSSNYDVNRPRSSFRQSVVRFYYALSFRVMFTEEDPMEKRIVFLRNKLDILKYYNHVLS